jgi:hypothetical protein
MKETLILLLILSEISAGVILAGLLLKAIWLPIQREFPAQTIAVSHFRRNFQSFSFGIFNAGFSFQVAIDDEYLHILPSLYLRVVGCKQASVPWSAIRLQEKQKPRFSKQSPAKLGKTEVVGPAWCFEFLKMQDRVLQ